MGDKPLGVLVMAYGTPKNLDDVEAYYTHIRRGHPPTAALLQDLVNRYKAIGGVSPLNEITQAQAKGIERALNEDGGRPCRVYLGNKHVSPFIADGVAEMAKDGIEEAVTLVLAPHYSSMSVATYQKAANAAAEEFGAPTLCQVDSWHLHPRFIAVLTERVRDALESFEDPSRVTVIFSAHSLPQKILEVGDPYPDQLRATGDAVAHALGHIAYTFAWQSAGRTNDPWLGPDILDVIRTLHAQGQREILVCSAGFVSDHLEVLYDIDVECQALATELGITLRRTASLNADPEFVQALAEVVRDCESTANNVRRAGAPETHRGHS